MAAWRLDGYTTSRPDRSCSQVPSKDETNETSEGSRYSLAPAESPMTATLTTNVLVRGHSSRWKYGDYGKKEQKVATMQHAGRDVVIIDQAGLEGLAEGIPAPTLRPHVPDAPAREPVGNGGSVGAPYRGPLEDVRFSGGGDMFRYPRATEQALNAHAGTVEALAKTVLARGYQPLIPPGQGMQLRPGVAHIGWTRVCRRNQEQHTRE